MLARRKALPPPPACRITEAARALPGPQLLEVHVGEVGEEEQPEQPDEVAAEGDEAGDERGADRQLARRLETEQLLRHMATVERPDGQQVEHPPPDADPLQVVDDRVPAVPVEPVEGPFQPLPVTPVAVEQDAQRDAQEHQLRQRAPHPGGGFVGGGEGPRRPPPVGTVNPPKPWRTMAERWPRTLYVTAWPSSWTSTDTKMITANAGTTHSGSIRMPNRNATMTKNGSTRTGMPKIRKCALATQAA